MTVNDIDWAPVELVDIEVEPSERHYDEREFHPVFSRRPSDIWIDFFVDRAMYDEFLTWDIVRGMAWCDHMHGERVVVRLGHVTAIANAAFALHVAGLRDKNPGDAARLLEEEASHASQEESWSRLGG